MKCGPSGGCRVLWGEGATFVFWPRRRPVAVCLFYDPALLCNGKSRSQSARNSQAACSSRPPPRGSRGGDSDLRTDPASGTHLARPRWSVSPQRVETARWGEHWLNKTLTTRATREWLFLLNLPNLCDLEWQRHFPGSRSSVAPADPAGRDDADGAGDEVWRILLGPRGTLSLFTGNCPASILPALNRGHHET